MPKTLKAMLVSIIKWHGRRFRIRALSALSDATFKDIGLHRSEIQSVASELTSEMAGSRIMARRNKGEPKPPAAASGHSMRDNKWKAAA